MIGGRPDQWASLWKKGGELEHAGVTIALNRFKTLLTYTNSDAASLTWQEAGKLVADGKAAFNVMGDWQDGYFSGTKAGGNLALKPNVTTAGLQFRERPASTTGCPTASRFRRALRTRPQLSSGSRSSAASMRRTRSPGGLDSRPQGREREALRDVPEVGSQAVEDGQARRILLRTAS